MISQTTVSCTSIVSVGVAINFVKNDDIRILRDIEQYYATQVDEMPMNGKIFCIFPFLHSITLINTILFINLSG
jgi:hypothetical protein